MVYCTGCNEHFAVTLTPAICPRCGVALVLSDSAANAETQMMHPAASSQLSNSPTETSGSAGPGESSNRLQVDSVPGDSQEPEATDELIGQDLHVYRVDAELGRGGMGRVFLAWHRDLERQCALKLLSPKAISNDVDYVRRFTAEGRAAASLVHPHVVTIHAIGHAQGHNFIEMEYVAGRSLQQLLDHEGRLTPIRATALVTRICEGLAAAHRQGIVHRDLKPDNILLTASGVPKIADFGLAKRILQNDGLPAGRLVGTPHFMAPELFSGHESTTASDVYALGMTWYLLLIGSYPWNAPALSQLARLAATEPLPLQSIRENFPEIPLEMMECLSQLLARTPQNRPQDATAALHLLQAVLGQLRDLESLLREAFSGMDSVRWERSNSHYTLHVQLPDGRSQMVHLEPDRRNSTEPLLLIYSVCGPANQDYFETALRLNSVVPHGGLAIREVEGESLFVMVDTYPRSTVDAEEIRRSVMEVASRADEVEHLLTGEDRH